MAAELFKIMAGVDMVHVPYRGSPPALTDLLSGQVQMMFAPLPPSIEYVRVGELRALAVTTVARSHALPDIPTVGEIVPGYEASGFYDLVSRSGVPASYGLFVIPQKRTGGFPESLAAFRCKIRRGEALSRQARTSRPALERTREPVSTMLRLVLLTIAIFLVYLTIGGPLAVIPRFVHDELGFGPLTVGIVVGAQAATTLLTRAFAGALTDRRGPKISVIIGALVFAAAAALYVVSAEVAANRSASLATLIIARLVLGFGDSLFITGGMAWAVQIGGAKGAGRGLVWVGIALYAAAAIGAPVGVLIAATFGFSVVSVAIGVLSLMGCLVAAGLPGAPVIPGPRISFRKVVGRIWKPGLGLALSAIGFAMIVTFITLYYQVNGWSDAAYALTAFGVAFIVARLFFGAFPDRYGGAPVALACLVIELIGQIFLWLAPLPVVAIAGSALTGFGYSLTFPALGIEAMKRVPPQGRGAALGAYAMCLDIAVAIGAPMAALLVGPYGYRSTYLLGAICAALAAVVAANLISNSQSGENRISKD
jgi:MFS family permease